ncbi:MAG: hypothetical protein U1F49_17980 [Rubrivivax sp.]
MGAAGTGAAGHLGGSAGALQVDQQPADRTRTARRRQPDAPVTQPGALDAGRERGGAAHGRRGGDVDPCLLVAEQQTRGRGRLGRAGSLPPAPR